MKSALTDREKQELLDIDKFNATTGRQGWHVKNKLFKEQTIARIELDKSDLTNVDFINVNGHNATISNSKFDQVRFLSGNFSGARFVHVEFVDCEFGGADFKDARFENCTLNGCQADRIKMENAVFDSCSFGDFVDKSGIYTRAQFLATRFQDVNWHNSSLHHATLENAEFVGGAMELVVFGDATITRLRFADVTLHSCGFNDGTISNLILESCRIKGITFGKSKITGMKIAACDDMSGLNLINSTCRQLNIEGCKGVSEPKFYLTELNDWTIKESSLSYLYCVESRLLQPGLILDCRISGANFSRATITGLTFENTLLANYLVLNGGIVERLALKNVSYDEKLEIEDQDVKYIDSDKFMSR